jgi:hypothetical protein
MININNLVFEQLPMKNIFLILFFSLISTAAFSQEEETSGEEPTSINLNDVIGKNKKEIDSIFKKPLPSRKTNDGEDKKNVVNEESGKANYLDYKIIGHLNDTVLIDTTLSILKDYKFNYLRKDLFGLHSMENQGQVFTELTYDFDNLSISPKMGANAKHVTYYQIEDIKYYRVPTPTSEFLYKTGMEQGQVLDSRLAINVHDRLNFSMAYRGLRSLGSYRNSLSSHKNFRGTLSYQSKSNRYSLKMHIANQTIENQENAGLTEVSLATFESNDSEFDDRGRLDVNIEDATSTLIGKRYYFDSSYKLLKTNDSIVKKITDLKVGHVLSYETKQYKFDATDEDNYFGTSFTSLTKDKTSYKSMDNKVYLNFNSPFVLGHFNVFAKYSHFYQGYQNVVITNTQTIPTQLKGNYVTAGASWNASIKNIYFDAKASTIITGDITGNQLFGRASFKNSKNIEFAASLLLNSKAPDFIYDFFQSNFISYNWNNSFKNIDTRVLSFEANTKWINASAAITQIENYLYFNADTQATPTQHNETVNYFKVKANNEIKVGHFALNTTAIFQKVADGASVFRVPDLVARSSFYYSKYLFKKKSLYLQTGITANYFSAYKAHKYNAVVGDFTLQNDTEIGGEPIFDLFINGQIRRTRIFVKAENLLSKFNKTSYYSAPNIPYRDFVVRFGIVWNFFN